MIDHLQGNAILEMKPTILNGTHLCLESLQESHRAELYEAAQDQNIWTYNSSKAYGEGFAKWFDKALAGIQKQEHLPFAVRRLSDQKIIGSTRFYDISIPHRRLVIGYTWYVPAVWGTYVNPECKLLLLQHAFETLRVNRVEFHADTRNLRSCAAIKKLGAVQEGVLRKHMVCEDGFVRDTAMFSIIPTEWRQVKEMLLQRLAITA